jgi:XTP/dITP diphosphohydrolase
VITLAAIRYCFITSNENKVRQARAILNRPLSSRNLEIPEIQSLDIEEVIVKKAQEAYLKTKEPVLVEDTGLYINSLNGFPGALVKWVLAAIKNEGICNLLKGPDRSAYAKTGVCIYDGDSPKTFYGRVDGIIVDKPRGTMGFGWAPIFQPNGHATTYGEMTEKEKNRISMRAKAFTELKNYLDEFEVVTH